MFLKICKNKFWKIHASDSFSQSLCFRLRRPLWAVSAWMSSQSICAHNVLWEFPKLNHTDMLNLHMFDDCFPLTAFGQPYLLYLFLPGSTTHSSLHLQPFGWNLQVCPALSKLWFNMSDVWKKSHATAILRFQLLHWTILAVALHSRCRALTSWDHANQSSCLTMITKKTRHKKARSCRSKVPHLCRTQRACFHTFEKLNSPYRVLTGMQHANLKLAAASVQLHKKTSKANPF